METDCQYTTDDMPPTIGWDDPDGKDEPVPDWNPSSLWGSGDGVLADAKLVYTPGWKFQPVWDHRPPGTAFTKQVCIAFYNQTTGITTLFIIYKSLLPGIDPRIQVTDDFLTNAFTSEAMKELETAACANAKELFWYIRYGLFEDTKEPVLSYSFRKVKSKIHRSTPRDALICVLNFCKGPRYDYPIRMYTVEG